MARALPRVVCATLAAFGALALVSVAGALTQPGTSIVIPVLDGGASSVAGLFAAEGDPIDAQANAADVPETFNPSCNLTFRLLSRGKAAYKNAFGWYNATGSKPATSDLHVLIPCTAEPPASFPLALKGSPEYAGGPVGFFMISPEGRSSLCASLTNIGYVYYSEKRFNPDNIGAGSYIHLLIYDSRSLPRSFYFAWEDLYSGGDNNFLDIVTRVDGIGCTGGGAPCSTGLAGACAEGTMQCQSGALACVALSKPAAERCDGIDNDCNGKADEGALCPERQVCDRGSCVPKCGSGEFRCPPAQVCNADGYCVEPSCAEKVCEEGKRCVGGACVGPCDGVTCPHGSVCRVGACVDPCAAVSCDVEAVCSAGQCVERCQCAGCPAGKTCLSTGACVATGCVGKTCAPGEYCAADGVCRDACAGAKCPAGQVCTAGACAPDVELDAGVWPDGGGLGEGGGTATTTVTTTSSKTGTATNTSGGQGGGGAAVHPVQGCGCRVGARGAGAGGGLFASLALLLVARRYRRKTPAN